MKIYNDYLSSFKQTYCSNRLEDNNDARQSKYFKQFAVNNFTKSVQLLCACFESLIDKCTQIL